MPIPWAPPVSSYGSHTADNISALLRDQGRARAEAGQRSAAIWGNAIQSLGQQVGGAITQHAETRAAEKKAQEKATQEREKVEKLAVRDGALAAAIESWDGQDPTALAKNLVDIAGPDDGLKLAQGVVSFRRLGTKDADPKQERADFDTTLKTAANLPGPLFERYYGGLREKLAPGGQKFLGWAPENIPAEGTPETQEMLRAFLKAQEGGGDKPKGPALGSFEDHVSRYASERGKTPEQLTTVDIEDARKRYNQSDDRPVIPGGGRGGLTENQEANLVTRWTATYDKLRKPVHDLEDQVARMDAGLEAARGGDMNAGSQAVITTFNKILDPTSVVRESEYDRSAAGQSLMAQARGYIEKIRKGGAGMPLDELEKYAKLARELAVRQSRGRIKAARKLIGRKADRYKIPHDVIFDDLDDDGPGPGGGPAGGGAAITVRAPNGKTYTFAGQAQADAFKKRAGIR